MQACWDFSNPVLFSTREAGEDVRLGSIACKAGAARIGPQRSAPFYSGNFKDVNKCCGFSSSSRFLLTGNAAAD